MARLISRPISWLSVATRPFVHLLSRSTDLLLRGSVPREGDSVEWAGWKFEVMDMDGNAIDKVLATKR